MRPVRLVPEPDDVLAHLPGVVPHLRLTRRVLVALHRVEIRGRGCLRVDDDVPATRESDDHVGRETSAVV
jgi:hypothetical protein